jgi:hypothetical protein
MDENQKCIFQIPSTPHIGSLKDLEFKEKIFARGIKKITLKEKIEGFEREILFTQKSNEISISYSYEKPMSYEELSNLDEIMEQFLKKSILRSKITRKNQIVKYLQLEPIIHTTYTDEIKKAAEEVISLANDLHEDSFNFQNYMFSFKHDNLAQIYFKLKNILTMGYISRQLQKSFNILNSEYLAWAILSQKLEQEAIILQEDGEFLNDKKLIKISKTFSELSTLASHSKQRIWRAYQNQTENLLRLSFKPKISNNEILEIENYLTQPNIVTYSNVSQN